MTVEKFFETLLQIDEFENELNLQTSLEAIREALNNLVSAPAQPQHQSALASAISAFDTATRGLADALTPNQIAAISEVGGHEYSASRASAGRAWLPVAALEPPSGPALLPMPRECSPRDAVTLDNGYR